MRVSRALFSRGSRRRPCAERAIARQLPHPSLELASIGLATTCSAPGRPHDPEAAPERWGFASRSQIELVEPERADALAHPRELAAEQSLTLLTATKQPEFSEAQVPAGLRRGLSGSVSANRSRPPATRPRCARHRFARPRGVVGTSSGLRSNVGCDGVHPSPLACARQSTNARPEKIPRPSGLTPSAARSPRSATDRCAGRRTTCRSCAGSDAASPARTPTFWNPVNGGPSPAPRSAPSRPR